MDGSQMATVRQASRCSYGLALDSLPSIGSRKVLNEEHHEGGVVMGISRDVVQRDYQQQRKAREAKEAAERADYDKFIERLQVNETEPPRNREHDIRCAINVFPGSQRDCDCRSRKGRND